MTGSKSSFSEELQRFVKFLQSVWGILAGISILFPLSPSLSEALAPARWPEGSLAYLDPTLLTIVATLTCLFVILWMFSQRQRFTRVREKTIRRKAVYAYGTGLIALILYTTLHSLIKADFYFIVLGWESDDPRRILGDILLLVAYTAAFSMITRGFSVFGLREFVRQGN